jgi:2-keto-myo-inositol isomerase
LRELLRVKELDLELSPQTVGCRRFNPFSVNFDAFHSWNTNSTLDDLRAIPVERISHYHIDDAHPNIPPLKQLDPDRVMIGDGVIDLKAELTVLKEKGYMGAISLELFNPDLWAQDPRDVLKLGFERLTALVQSV